jgi:hypothetical protein
VAYWAEAGCTHRGIAEAQRRARHCSPSALMSPEPTLRRRLLCAWSIRAGALSKSKETL